MAKQTKRNDDEAPQAEAAPVETRNKFPELQEMFDRLQAEREELLTIVDPLRQERDKIVQEMLPYEMRARELADEMKKYKPRLAELDSQLSGLARAMGGRALSDNVK